MKMIDAATELVYQSRATRWSKTSFERFCRAAKTLEMSRDETFELANTLEYTTWKESGTEKVLHDKLQPIFDKHFPA